MRQKCKIRLAAILTLVICILAGCAVSKPATSQQMKVPNKITSPTVTTAPALTSALTEPADIPFDPVALALQIPDAVKQEMKQAFPSQIMPHFNLTAKDVHIERVFAIFDFVYVLYVEVDGLGYADVEDVEIIGGICFEFPDGQDLFVYSDGQFYRLQEAFDAQVIGVEELLVVKDNYYNAYPWCKP